MKTIVLFALLAATSLLHAQTVITNDTISGVFTKANSPYIITNNTTVFPDSALIIEPGVRVEFKNKSRLTVLGSLVAVGTETDSIYFTACAPDTAWEGIRIIDTKIQPVDSSKIAFVVISKAFIAYEVGSTAIYGGALTLINAAKVVMHDVLFTGNAGSETNFDTLISSCMTLKNSEASMRNIVFKKNYGADGNSKHTLLADNSTLWMENILIDSCFSDDAPGFSFWDSNTEINNLTVQNCSTYTAGGVVAVGSIIGGKHIISSLKAYNNFGRAGLVISNIDSSSILANFDIHNNNTLGRSFDHRGAIYYEGLQPVTFYNFKITNNASSGIYISNSYAGLNHKLNLVNGVIADNLYNGIEQHDNVRDSLSINIINTIIWGNVYDGIKLHNPGEADINVYYSNLQYPWDELDIMDGVKHDSPEFRNNMSGDYHLLSSSPLIDKGDPSAYYNDRTMSYLAGQKTERNDMGAYGGIYNNWNSDVIANFTTSVNFGKPPLSVQFTDRSLNSPTKWEWDFDNDGSIDSRAQHPTFVYTQPGEYSVRLIASKKGSADTLLMKKLIVVPTEKVIGAVYGQWVYDTIQVIGDIFIPKDSTLTINPGTKVYFKNNYSFDVYGTLRCIGTASQKIQFYCDSLYEANGNYYGWKGISFKNTEIQNQTASAIHYTWIRNTVPQALAFENASNVSTKNLTIQNFRNFGIKQINSDLILDSIRIADGINAYGISTSESELSVNKAILERIANGGAIKATNSKLLVEYANFDSNTVEYSGGGAINTYNCDVTIKQSTFRNNTGKGGGALFIEKGITVNLQSVVITNNRATTGVGGGAIFYDCQPELTNVVFNMNSSYNGAGGLYIGTQQNWQTPHKAILQNCLITKNKATNSSADGGGIVLGYNVYAKINNTTIADNASAMWGGLYAATTDLPHDYRNVIVYNNGTDRSFQAACGPYMYSLIEGNYNGMDTSTTNLNNALPLFRDTTAADYHLQSVSTGYFVNSPAIDKGDPSISDLLIGNDFGLGTNRSDIGAYGGTANDWDSDMNPPCYYRGKVKGIWDCPTIFVNGNIYLAKGDTLSIAPGTNIVFLGAFSFKIDGVIRAVGTSAQPIIFASADTIEGWRGISFVSQDTALVGTSVFDNVVFNHAHAKGTTSAETRGGAMYIYRSSRVKVRNSNFQYNYAAAMGGAMYISYSKPTLEKITFKNNHAVLAGGAIYFEYSDSGSYHRLEVQGNKAKEGAGIFFDHSSPKVTNALLTNNETTVAGVGSGGAMFFQSSSPVLSNITTAFNFAGNGGGAIGLSGACDPNIINSIFALDTKPEINFNGAQYTFRINYSQIEEGAGQPYFGINSFDAIPYFRNMNLRNFRLQAIPCGYLLNAPGIDAGHPDSLDMLLDCNAGLGSSRADVGYYGGRFEDSISVGLDDELDSRVPKDFSLNQNFPNPFNPSTVIGFQLPRQTKVSIIVYDLLGREVKTLLDEERSAGVHHIRFDAKHLATGVYIYQLRAGSFTAAKKLLLIK